MRSAPRTTTSVLAFVIAASALLAANRAQAQTGGTTGTVAAAKITAADFSIVFKEYVDEKWVQMNAVRQQYFFNQARCLCGQSPKAEFKVLIQPAAGAGQKIQALLQENLTGGGQGVGRLFAGAQGYNCLAPTAVVGGAGLGNVCTNLLDPYNYPGESFAMSIFANSPYWESEPIPVAYLFNSLKSCGINRTCDATDYCSTTSTQTNIQFWAQTNSGTAPDFDPGPPAAVALVGQVPLVPTNVAARGGNEALVVSWDWPENVNIASASATVYGVQIFCQRGADHKVFEDGTHKAAFTTTQTVCEEKASTIEPPNSRPFSNLDPKFLCSGLIPTGTTSYRIRKLQNGITYSVGVAAVDKYGNIGPISNIVYEAPIPTVDFYTQYKGAGGDAQGGFCALASHHARPGVLTLAGLAVLGLVLRRRGRSKRRPPGVGTIVMLVAAGTLTASQVHAQTIYHDGSFVQDRASEAWGGSPRQFAVEARFGMYMPNIDSEFSGSEPRPQANVFGTKRRPMWQMEFDWEILQVFGTLSVGGVIGYYKETAKACTKAGLDTATGECGERSGDDTSLRLIPLAALLVYRLDEAAERWNIPFVPYAKVGFNYTLWTVTDGNGNVASATGGNGQGGTMGWQAAVGLSLRLDFIDPSAARGFDAESGVNHTYAFFELAHVNGSGLYRKDVLRVGDSTWFAGLMFEF